MTEAELTREPTRPAMYHGDASDPRRDLIDLSLYDDETVRQISELLAALGHLRETEREIMRASQEYMDLSETDMRAVHFIIGHQKRDVVATPGAIAAHLSISTASTTKLLDRLERGGHVVRHSHPSDRRALAITVTEKTRKAATDSVGRKQSRRFYAAARLSAAEREVVTRFLEDMTREISEGSGDAPQPAST